MTRQRQRHDEGLSFAEAYERSEDTAIERPMARPFAEIVERRIARRTALLGLGAAGTLALAGRFPARAADASLAVPESRFDFEEIARGVDENHHVAPGHAADILIRWGDPVGKDAPAFDPLNQSAEAQARQFGYNCDYVGFAPLASSTDGADGAGDRGLLCVNHEFTSREVMFPDMTISEVPEENADPRIAEIEMAAHGGSVLEIEALGGGAWRPVAGSRLSRRITGMTPMRISGPAAGVARLKTNADPSGTKVLGTLNNCAGGMTPWGTYLMAEENVHGYFWGDEISGHPEEPNFRRMGIPANWYPWGLTHDRFHIAKEPNEANRFGWVTEVDPFDPAAAPVKRTALGRFKHEGAEPIVNGDGRIVVYMGDDQRFEHLYKFVSARPFEPGAREANRALLDEGTLYVARFADDGRGEWVALVHGENGLDASNGFESQADVLIEARRAADTVGATPMDRPEDVEPNPVTGKVYVALTNNVRREPRQVNAANPRPYNLWGQIVELVPDGGDHGAAGFSWELLVKCGNPAVEEIASSWNPATSRNGWFACPDNMAVDPKGRLWVATDQGRGWPITSGSADGIWSLETEGAARGTAKALYRVPVGAEMCGPRFTPDGRTLFVAVQHPATDGAEAWEPFGRKSTFEDPATRWPDFDPAMPPRPSVVAIRREGGGIIGG